MSLADWLAHSEPYSMLSHLQGKASRRKLRLFACACARRVLHLLPEEPCRRVIEVAERYADSKGKRYAVQSLLSAVADVENVPDGIRRSLAELLRDSPQSAAAGFSGAAAVAVLADFRLKTPGFKTRDAANTWLTARDDERQAQCVLLDDIFGDRFRTVTIKDSWLTSNVVSVAQAIYDERAFDRMPILGDALEDAGCTDGDVLNHCRQPGVHVRGCWLLDLLVGKE